MFVSDPRIVEEDCPLSVRNSELSLIQISSRMLLGQLSLKYETSKTILRERGCSTSCALEKRSGERVRDSSSLNDVNVSCH